MSDIYTEQLLKKQSSGKDKEIKVLLVILTLGIVIMALGNPVWLLGVFIMAAVDVWLFRSLDVEYEYLYINGNLDIDKIMSKSRRKKAFEMEITDLEVMAPKGAAELRLYQSLKARDYSSGSKDGRLYEMIVIKNGEKKRIIFEPNDVIVDGMSMMAPRKVHK